MVCRQRAAFPGTGGGIALVHGYTSSMPPRPEEKRRTEQRHPASMNLDCMSALQIVQLINREDRKVANAVARELPHIAAAVEAIVRAIRRGGRLIYVGAGTSGRLAMLDAVELPPTYGIGTDVVMALIAGGKKAATGAVEGAEDSASAAGRDLRAVRLRRRDVVLGIAASGTTPYVLSALQFARRRRAGTIALTANRQSPLAKLASISIAPEVGCEVVTGSTRMKAGTSQKMVLNMLSTAAMVRLGHTYENLMIDLVMNNKKLTGRGLRMLAEASGAPLSSAQHALRQSGHNLRVALVMLKKKVSAKAAAQLLRAAKNDLRAAMSSQRRWPDYRPAPTQPTLRQGGN
jgi:N-acetylmuramic acid 6-phosphate etherase